MKNNRLLLIFAALLVLVVSVLVPVFAQGDLPEEIDVKQQGIMPEGIEYDASGSRFLIGSLADGKIRQVMDDGSTRVFIDDPDLTSTVGLQIDEARQRLLVANSDSSVMSNPDAAGTAGLAAYDLTSGDRLFYVDLAAVASDGRNFANDVTVDADGNAYVTNSFSPIIYKVDPDGNASVFARDDRFSADGFGLNGIVTVPGTDESSGYLLAAVTSNSTLFKIPLDAPDNVTEVELNAPFGGDGMVYQGGTLFAVANNFAMPGSDTSGQAIVGVSSNDDWASAVVQANEPTDGSATTIALRESVPYYINAHLSDPQAQQYEIMLVQLAAG